MEWAGAIRDERGAGRGEGVRGEGGGGVVSREESYKYRRMQGVRSGRNETGEERRCIGGRFTSFVCYGRGEMGKPARGPAGAVCAPD